MMMVIIYMRYIIIFNLNYIIKIDGYIEYFFHFVGKPKIHSKQNWGKLQLFLINTHLLFAKYDRHEHEHKN